MIASPGFTRSGAALALVPGVIACLLVAWGQSRALRSIRCPAWLTWLILALGLLPMAWNFPPIIAAYALAVPAALSLWRTAAAAMAVAVGTTLIIYPVTAPARVYPVGDALVELTVVALILAILLRLPLVVEDADQATAQLARASRVAYRKRVTRDVHDLVGRTLVVATLHNQVLMQRLGDGHPAQQPLSLVHDEIVHAQVLVRALTTAPPVGTIDEEVAVLRQVCRRESVRLTFVGEPAMSDDDGRSSAALLLWHVGAVLAARPRSSRCEVQFHDSYTTARHDGFITSEDAHTAYSALGEQGPVLGVGVLITAVAPDVEIRVSQLGRDT